MNEFKTILTKLKEILKLQLQTDKKVLDKDIATALNIKPSTLASYKRRDKPPYKAILTYCHENRLNVTKILYDSEPILDYPRIKSNDKMKVKCFKSLKQYEKYLTQI